MKKYSKRNAYDPTVTVVTSSIGRPELERTIASIEAQTYPCKHMVFVNGERWHATARPILARHSNVQAIFLEEETGDCGIGPGYSGVFSAAPFLTTSDYIFYCNDDDWYDPTHVDSLVRLMEANDASWGYALRRFVRPDGTLICDDDFDSLGFWPCIYDRHGGNAVNSYLVDNSCFAVSRHLAIDCAQAWHVPHTGDRSFLRALKASRAIAVCTGQVSVNYTVGLGTATTDLSYYDKNTRVTFDKYGERLPWRKPNVFRPASNGRTNEESKEELNEETL